MVLVLSAHFWLYFPIHEIITDAETDNIDEIPLFGDENQHFFGNLSIINVDDPILRKVEKS